MIDCLVRTGLLASLLSIPCFAQTGSPDADGKLSQHDRDLLISSLQSTRKLFLDSVAGLTPEQWSFKAAPDRWSIAECADHIAISEAFISGLVRNQVMKTPATPEKRQELKATDEQILQMTTDRSHKFKAPEPIDPTKHILEPEAAVAQFKEAREQDVAYAEKTQDELRYHFLPHPAAGLMDGYQWLLLMSAHTERHTLQIQEVKTDPKFPK